jgi:RimJ/RimL family protein N-acetyltransferase
LVHEGELMAGPAYRVLTPRLLLRCWDPADAPKLLDAIERSLEHLRPWMPWAWNEPESLDAKVDRLRRMRADFDRGRDFVYGIFTPDGSTVIGGTGLHARVGPGAKEIGYWIHLEHTGRGYATEAAAALTRVAFEVEGVQRVEIHCDPQNGPSASVPRKLGYRHDATLRRRTMTSEGTLRDSMVWSLLREELPASPVARVEVRAYDALGRQLL